MAYWSTTLRLTEALMLVQADNENTTKRYLFCQCFYYVFLTFPDFNEIDHQNHHRSE
jgi:hypothetical protein